MKNWQKNLANCCDSPNSPKFPSKVFYCTVATYLCTYVSTYSLVMFYFIVIRVASSPVADATVTLVLPNITSELYNITVTCTIHPNRTADQCIVMVMADGRMTKTGTLGS